MYSRAFARWGIVLILLAGGAYIFQDKLRISAQSLYRVAIPCTAPITYSIGMLDPKFGLSRAELEDDLARAAGLWNDAYGGTLFKHQEGGAITVELIYDSRQAMTDSLNELGLVVKDDKETYDAVKARYDSLYAQYEAKKRSFERDLMAYRTRENAYDAKVKHWNSRGGAPESEYILLQREREALQAESDAILQEQESVNRSGDSVNDLALELNRLIKVLNLNVAEYNATGARTDGEFEEGTYERSGAGERITVYEYDTKAHLIRVLAHELGHAAGLEHVDDTSAIMYYLNRGKSIALTKADTEELAAACRLND